MLTIVLAHMVGALVGVPLVRMLGRNAFFPLSVIPAASCLWLLSHNPVALTEDPQVTVVPWIPDFQVSLTFRLDTLSWILGMIATAIGTMVLLYCARYFKDTEPGLGRFASVLTAFAGAMVGLVFADDVMLLYTFWELTTVFSYLLIGHYMTKQSSRRAATNALISTTIGGLAMMVGLLMLAGRAGSMLISEILASPMWHEGSAYAFVALLLVMSGAATKSALVPTHFWLPGAMAAPTPVSAYLHAAAMVKAGVYLIIRFAPALAHMETVSVIVCAFGAATMIVGGWRALRQTDVKLLLAYGTVSQLGFLSAVAGIATRNAVLAAVAMMIAHSVFKAPLFMIVGVIDKKFGTRDLRKLSGVWRVAPITTVIGVLSAASMAAVPPLWGFVTKEAVYSALWYEGGWNRVLLAVLVAGSILTVAYSWRFVWGAFGPAADAEPAASVRIPVMFWLPAAVIAASTVVFPMFATPIENTIAQVAIGLPHPPAKDAHLVVIPHLGVPLLLSVLTLGLGALLCVIARPLERFQERVSPQTWATSETLEDLFDAERGFRALMRAVDWLALRSTAIFQRGSLPLTLATMLIVLIAMVVPLTIWQSPTPDNLVWFHHPVELLVLPIVIISAIGAARSRRRLRAVFLISVTGYATAILFLYAGAPDVATTQVLVETAMTVVLILVLRRLPAHFSRRPASRVGVARWAIAIGTAAAMCGAVLLGSMSRSVDPLGPELVEPAYTIGGGHNVVNVTLVDARVWDTMGEISVLLVVATGVASLIFVNRREQRISRVDELDGSTSIWRRKADPSIPQNALDFDTHDAELATGNRWRTWISAGLTLAPERRMVILEVITRLIFPLIMMFSVYLLMAGHNLPGGGFAGGLVAGLALTLRYLAGGRYELSEALPVQAGSVLGLGLFIAISAAVLPLPFGGNIFTSATPVFEVPMIGEVHLPSALIFDVGVYLVVIGVMLDFLRSLGSQIDQQQEVEADAS